MGQDTVKLSWAKLDGLLRKIAIEFLQREMPELSYGSGDVDSPVVTRVVRAGVAHMLHSREVSDWNPGPVFMPHLTNESYKDFLEVCSQHKLTIREHSLLTSIRGGKSVVRDAADCLARYISESLGKRITVVDLMDTSSGSVHATHPSDSLGATNGAVIEDLTECFSDWPELVAQVQKMQGSALHPIELLLAQPNLSAMLDNVLHSAVSVCLKRELKSGGDFSDHWNLAKRILGNVCVLEVSAEWLLSAQSQPGASRSILEVSVNTAFGVEVVRAGRWGGVASFCDIKVRTAPAGKHAIFFHPDADETGASSDLALEKVLRSVWSKMLPAPSDALPVELRLATDAERLKSLNRALSGERKKFHRFHYAPVNLQSSSYMTLAGVCAEVSRLVPELHVILWGTASSAELPVFRGDETDAWNSVAEFLLIPSFLKDS